MSEVEPARAHDERPGEAPAEEVELGPAFDPWALLWWTVPLHAALPLVIAMLGRTWEVEMGWAWLIVHLAFPIVLIWSWPLWRGRGEAMAAVIVIDHIVTFAVGTALAAHYWG